ncbi:O-antigen ligase family protein [Mastigocoleus sp. MO_188.B34]|uniref:O-antigen ligase family protein n=1 Tax=Mastigocoleus sp. MO_188.B34 TaxID=3036635 RepID=UPI0026095CCB|nr:O-antigen ligase family protein [Mastigocoleus sp. MO_188.B34]MDJ0696976.1 O-antigen ligase family protein [Mastigocoleus sp. MO_188.B34]
MSTAIFKNLNHEDNKSNLGEKSFIEGIIYWIIVLTPLWWLLGIQTLFYPAVASYLIFMSFRLEKLLKISVPICIWSWLAMSIVMLWTAIIGISNLNLDLIKIAASGVTLFKSYFLIFSCLVVPFWQPVRAKIVTRAIAWMATGYLVTLAIQLAILAVFGPLPPLMTPLANAVPPDSNKLALVVKFATIQDFFGIPLPRTDLYTADPPILGACALLCFFICLAETNPRLRKFSVLGSLIALLAAQSRISWLGLPLGLLVLFGFRSSWLRQGYLWLASFTCLICSCLGLSFQDLINKPLEIFTSARAESSSDRELVIKKTIEAWQEKPWIGWGVVHETVKWHIYEVDLGSFSTYTSVLYLHGIFGFIVFIFALISTLSSFWKTAINGNLSSQLAFTSLIALYFLLNATPLSWMVVYFWFFFIWLGANLAEIQENRKNVVRWEQLETQIL